MPMPGGVYLEAQPTWLDCSPRGCSGAHSASQSPVHATVLTLLQGLRQWRMTQRRLWRERSHLAAEGATVPDWYPIATLKAVMPKIRSGDGTVTHINTFTCSPNQQQALVDSLVETIAAAKTLPDWISASLHRSFDGTHVVNYVQFESHEAAQAVTGHLLITGHLQRNFELGTVTPGQYEVVHTLTTSDPPAGGADEA